MSLDWSRLRTWNGSQRHAFEELCCQIAARVEAPADSVFKRIGAPDAGVECIWTLPSNAVWGWQAKFFLTPPTPAQWTEIDESFRRVLDAYPELQRFTVCLPIDRSDARIQDRTSFMDRWNTRVQKWNGWASSVGRSVEFEYWGEHELLEALARREHTGRVRFWFNREILDSAWLESHLERALEDAGPRYSQKLNVQLEISEVFDGLEKSPRFVKRLIEVWTPVWKEFNSVDSPALRAAQLTSFQTLASEIQALRELILDAHDAAPTAAWPDIEMLAGAKRVATATWECEADVEGLANQAKQEALAHGPKHVKPGQVPQEPQYKSEDYHLRMLGSRLRDLQDFLSSDAAKVARVGALLLEGTAGTGKTHLFCDVARRAVSENRVAVVLLGEKFTRDEPWVQIARQLGLSEHGADEILGTLSAAAEASGQKALLLIDALNEGEGRFLWHRYLAGFLAAVRRYPWVVLGLSVRSSYTRVVVPENLGYDRLVRLEHQGFSQAEVRATRAFFDFYRIERPSVPVLTPEFSNPLFLTLFCKGLKNAGLNRIPDGLEGISAIFGFFVSSVDEKLAHEERLGFDPQSRLVDRAVSALAQAMADEGLRWLPRDRAKAVVNALLPRDRYEHTLFRGLLVEGVLSEEVFYARRKQLDGVRFTYERFADHRIARYLLEEHFDPADPTRAFQPGAPLHPLVKDFWAAYQNRGILEAFSIQLPEQASREFIELVPAEMRTEPVLLAFLESLLWRRPETIREETRELVNLYLVKDPETFAPLLNVLLTVACNPRHPWNAEFLHARLMGDSMAERDVWWSTYLFRSYGRHGAVDRLVDWALTTGTQAHHSDESVELCCIALAWFLTTSHRFVRDRATKGMVALLQDRISVLHRVMVRFREVNDPYVRERLYAVAYGCALRTSRQSSIEGLARDVFAEIFASGSPPPHILLRDYARGIIEVAAHHGFVQDLDLTLIRPPYSSTPPAEPPSEEELRTKHSPDVDRKFWELWESVMAYGDFERYIIGTNSHSFEFSRRALKEPWEPPTRTRYNRFVEEIPKRARRAWQILERILETSRAQRAGRPLRWLEEWADGLPEGTDLLALLKVAEEKYEHRFFRYSGKKRRAEYERAWKNYDPLGDDPDAWDLKSAQRWIFNRVIELGWSPERFGEFDSQVDEKGRSPHKPERIGKKYQWIAYHEYIARVADNFEFRGQGFDETEQRYNGPWQGFWRDIDPSMLAGTVPLNQQPTCQADWNPVTYNAWRFDLSDDPWLADESDLPGILDLLPWTDPRDGTAWLLLDGTYIWEQPRLPDTDRYGGERRRLEMSVSAHIMRAKDAKRVHAWAHHRNLSGPGIPQGLETNHVFRSEYPWAPAFVNQYGAGGGLIRNGDGCPVRLIPAANTYHWSGTDYDCSIDDALNIHVPSALLLPKRHGLWPCPRSRATFLSPGVWGGPNVLLARNPEWHDRLKRQGREVIWLMMGLKSVWRGHSVSTAFLSGAAWARASGWQSSLTMHREPPRNRR